MAKTVLVTGTAAVIGKATAIYLAQNGYNVYGAARRTEKMQDLKTDLGNFYQTYLELRNRKMNRTKFLDTLREELIRRMDERDEK